VADQRRANALRVALHAGGYRWGVLQVVMAGSGGHCLNNLGGDWGGMAAVADVAGAMDAGIWAAWGADWVTWACQWAPAVGWLAVAADLAP
jgi:hypothetical protein